jgi:hypothetical protein
MKIKCKRWYHLDYRSTNLCRLIFFCPIVCHIVFKAIKNAIMKFDWLSKHISLSVKTLSDDISYKINKVTFAK